MKKSTLIALFTAAILFLGSFQIGWGQTYHDLSSGTFTQNWTDPGLITAANTWTGVPSIIGYGGNDITTSTGANPQTLLGEGIITINVQANQTNPNTNTSGGLAEFAIADPVVAFQGSGTSDAPNIIIFLNTTGCSNVLVQYNLRDIDGSADNAVQPVALQYRVGTTGNFTNIPVGFVADASSGPSLATLVTAVTATLPVAAENQSQVQVRIITSNAVGSDEWIGIDDIVITNGGTSMVATPEFTPLAGNYFTPQSVTITCSTPDATIYYTTNGTDPNETSTPYSLPFPVSVTTTIKAKAFKTAMTPSPLAIALYRFPIDVADITTLRSGLTDGTVYRLTGEAVVTLNRPNTPRHQIYIQDATAAIVVDDPSVIITTPYTIGDGITGITGTLFSFNSLLEFVPLQNPAAASSTGNIITPLAKTLSTITSADQAKLVSIPAVSFTTPGGNYVASTSYPVTDAGGSGSFRALFAESDYIGTPIPAAPQNMIALVGQTGTTLQITPRFAADLTTAPPTWTAGYPKAEDAGPTFFNAKVNLSSPGTAYLVVLPNGAAAPSALQVKNGQDATGTPVAPNLTRTIICPASGTIYAADSVFGLSPSTTYNVHFVAEAYSVLQGSAVMVPLTTTTGANAPLVISPTAASITSNSAVLGGDISYDGGSPITERGTVWSLITPVTIADNKLVEGGTSVAVFTQLRSPLPSATLIYYAAYAKNDIGTTLSAESSFTTFAPEPTNHASAFTAGTVTTTSIPLAWTDATGIVLPNAYLIKGSAIGYSNIIPPVDGIPEANSALVQNVNFGLGTYTFTGLTPGTPYYFKIYSYTNSGTAIDYKPGTVPDPTPQATATTLSIPVGAILYEDFNYTAGSNIGGNTASSGTTNNNWTTHSNTKVGTIDVISGNLSYSGLAASSGNKVLQPGNNTLVPRDINRAIPFSTNSVMYFSTLVNVLDSTQLSGTTPDYFMNFGATSGATVTLFGARLGIKKVNSTSYRLSILNTSGGTTVYTEFAQDLSYATTYFVVVKYDRSTSPTTAYLWVNPSNIGSTEPAGFVSNNSGTSTFASFGSICLRNSATTPKAEIDEIRVGNTWADVTLAGPTDKTLNAKAYIEGFWNGTAMNQVQDADIDLNVFNKFSGTTVDTLSILLAEANPPWGYVYQAHAVNINPDGTMSVTIPSSYSGSYYIVIKQRNSIETWSANAVDFSGSNITYHFTTAASQAFGSNQKDLIGDGTVWGLYSGDFTSSTAGIKDEYVDFFDLNEIFNLNLISAAGYQAADITGDGFVDFFDINMAYNNNLISIGMNTPPNPAKRPGNGGKNSMR